MQQQQPYPSYPYYPPAPMYPQTPYMGTGGQPAPSGGYPPFYGPPQSQPQPAPHNPNPPAPAPYSFDAAAYAVNPNAPPANRQSRHYRRSTIPAQQPAAAQPQPPAAAPLKSAMKKTMSAFDAAENTITRQFSNPFNNQQAQQNQAPVVPRTRVYSNPTHPQNPVEEPVVDSPFHMIVSFHGYNEMHIEHIMKHALDDLRKLIWPIWTDGMESESVTGHTCIAKFRNMPWDLSGPNVKNAYKLIAEFFRLFQSRGYSFQTAVNIGTTTPRLIFQVTKPETSDYFIAYFSQEGRRVTLINPPNHVDISIGARLRSALPRKALTDNVVEDYMRVIEVKRRANISSSEVDPSIFFKEVLRILNTLGFQLDASIPLGRRGPLGIKYPRELLVFRGMIVRES